jgi:hypothetical protein
MHGYLPAANRFYSLLFLPQENIRASVAEEIETGVPK